MKSSSVCEPGALISVTSPPQTGHCGFFSYSKVCVYGDSVPEYALKAHQLRSTDKLERELHVIIQIGCRRGSDFECLVTASGSNNRVGRGDSWNLSQRIQRNPAGL